MTAETELIDAPAETAAPLEPSLRAQSPDIEGMPIALGGATWLLALPGLDPRMTPLRDRLYDRRETTRSAGGLDILEAAWLMLSANYVVTPEEAAGLLRGADKQALCDAVMDGFFSPADEGKRTYTDWVMSTLLANSVDPTLVPARLLPYVLEQLVFRGDAMPQEEFISSAQGMAMRRMLPR
jgi:hypothetical protein